MDTTTLLAVLAILSPIASMTFGVIAMRRGQKTDDTSSGREMGTIQSDLGYVKSSVDAISKKLDGYDTRFIALTERVASVEQKAKSAHSRLDGHNTEIESLRKRYHDLGNKVHPIIGRLELDNN